MAPDVFGSGWQFLYEMLGQDFQYPDPEKLVVFVDNHDMPRIFTKLEESIPGVKWPWHTFSPQGGFPKYFMERRS